MSELLLDRAGRRRSPATMPGFHAGRPPHNKGLRYPADPRLRRSSLSCAAPATVHTAAAYAPLSCCCGEQGCGFTRRLL